MAKVVDVRLRRILSVLMSLAVIVIGLCLIGACLHIYYAEGAYSREIVANAFSLVAVPVYICLAVILIGCVWEFFAPAATEYCKAPKMYAATLKKLHATRTIGEEDAKAVAAEQKRRRLYTIFRYTLAAVGAITFLQYAARPTHYTEDINASMIRAMWVAVPCFVIPAATFIITAFQCKKSYEREIAVLKKLPKHTEKFVKAPVARVVPASFVITMVLIVAAVAVMIFGFVSGGTVDVLTKAINICTECIGLG